MSVREYYNDIAARYDEDRFGNSYGSYIHRQEVGFFSEVLLNKTSTLDIACGTGRFLGYATHGVDFSEEMLKKAKERFPSKELYLSDAAKLPFPDRFFDQALSMHFVMHLTKEKTKDVLNETNRVLKDQGIFVFDFPSARRRRLVGFKSDGWHASNSFTLPEIQRLAGENWKLIGSRGVLFFPIHRLPVFMRRFFLPIDNWLCRSFLKEYSSYLIVILKKQPC